MANGLDILTYKEQILNIILSDYQLVRLIDDKYVDTSDETTVEADELRYINVFPYMYKPDTETEQRAYVFAKVDTPRVTDNLLKDMQITIVVASHQGIMKVPFDNSGTRIDIMSACIDRLFNGRDDIGFGYLSLVSNTEESIDTVHRCRTIKFRCEEFNQSRCS